MQITDAPTIAEYSPNIRWGQQHVEIVLKQWKYEARFVETVGGTCTGMDVFEGALSSLYDKLDPARVVLTAPDGATLLCEDEEDRGDEWLKAMCVSLRIIAYDPPTLNEVRRMNGAPPVPGGDKPHPPL